MHDRVILLKLLMALAGALVCVVLWRLPWVRRLSNGQFTAMTIGLLVGGRLGFYTLVYLVQGQPVPTDVPTYYYPEAVKTLSGLLPYRDFASSYAPLFDYLGAAMIYLWNDTRVYVLTAIAADVLAMPIWLAVGRRLFAENVVRTAAILYVTNVKALLSVCTGQNQIWIALLLAAAWWLRLRGRPFWSGMMLGLGLSAVKVLVLILTPPVWLAGGRRLMWLVGFAAIPAVVYLGFIALGADVLLQSAVSCNTCRPRSGGLDRRDGNCLPAGDLGRPLPGCLASRSRSEIQRHRPIAHDPRADACPALFHALEQEGVHGLPGARHVLHVPDVGRPPVLVARHVDLLPVHGGHRHGADALG
jgi:F0F1-type ATP synthase assembly protein I